MLRPYVAMRLLLISILCAATCAGQSDAKISARCRLPSTREVFDVSLVRTSGYLLSARGRTVVETHINDNGDTRTLQRSLLDMTYKDGQPMRTDFVIETWESGDGRTLRFDVSNTQTGYGTEKHSGSATLAADGGGKVNFTSSDKPFSLPRGTMLPVAFSHAILDAARKGQDLDNRIVFQGGARNALVTASVRIGARETSPHARPKDPDGLLKGAAVWPVLMSYYSGGSDLPASEVATELYTNGTLGSLSFVYPQFTVKATLASIARLPSAHKCGSVR